MWVSGKKQGSLMGPVELRKIEKEDIASQATNTWLYQLESSYENV